MSTDDTTSTTVDGTSMAFVANKRRIRGERRPRSTSRSPRPSTASIWTRVPARPATASNYRATPNPPTTFRRPRLQIGTSCRGRTASIRWNADDVFVNPPFSDVEEWLATAIGAWVAGDAGRVFFVTAANTGTLSWYHRWIASFASVTYFTGPRQNYIDPETGELASGVSFNTAVSVCSGEIPESLAEY